MAHVGLKLLEEVVVRCRQRGFDAIALANELKCISKIKDLLPESFYHSVETKSNLYGYNPAYHAFCDGMLGSQQSDVLAWFMVASELAFKSHYVAFIEEAIAAVVSICDPRDKQKFETEQMRLRQIYQREVRDQKDLKARAGLSRRNSFGTKVEFWGNWPTQVKAFFNRNEGDMFENALRDLCSNDGKAIVVHGTGGLGKTTLAVFIIRQRIANRLATPEFGSIEHAIWINVNQLCSPDGLIEYKRFDDKAFFEKLHGLLTRAEILPENTRLHPDAMKAKLKKNVLIVLDDVFHSGALRCMAKLGPRVRVIALTRNPERAMFSCAWFRSEEFLLKFMTHEQLEDMLYNFFGLSRILSKERHIPELAKVCLGLPLIASVINQNFHKLLEGSKVEKQFNEIVENYRKIAETDVIIDKIEKGEDEDDNQKELAISKLVTFSPDFESSEFRQNLNAFLLFPRGSYVDAYDLMIIWKCDSQGGVAELCQDAVTASILQQRGDHRNNTLSYFLHDLLNTAIMQQAIKSYRAGDPVTLKKMLLEKTFSNDPEEGHNCLRQAIELNRPSLLQLFLDLANPAKLLQNYNPKVQRLLAAKCSDIAMGVWQVSSNSACVLLSLYTELALSNVLDISVNNETLFNTIVNSMSDKRQWYQNVFLSAVQKNCEQVIELCLRTPVIRKLIAVKDCDGNDAILFCSANGNVEMLKKLLETGDFVTMSANNFGETALWHCSASDKCLEVAQQLAAKFHPQKDLINMVDKESGLSALHQAIKQGRYQLVCWLVDCLGADVNLKAKQQTALELLLNDDKDFDEQRTEIGKYLVKKQTRKLSRMQLTLISEKAEKDRNVKMTKFLEENFDL